MDYNALLKQYPGYNGWGQAEALADFNATGGSGKGGSVGGGGSGAPGYTIPDIKLSDVGGSAVDFAKGLNAEGDKAFDSYVMAQRGQERPLDTFSRLENEANIPQLRKTATTLSGQVFDLEDTIRRLEPDINARTSNSLVTEAQRRGMLTEARRPLQENLGWLGQSLGRVMQGIQQGTADIGNKVNLSMQGQQMELEPYKMRINMMSERAARLMTGFTADREVMLTSILEKIKAGNQLSLREMDIADNLAREEREYNRQKEMLTRQSEVGLQEYEKRKQIDQRYKEPDTSSNWLSSMFGGFGANSNSDWEVAEVEPLDLSRIPDGALSFDSISPNHLKGIVGF